MINLFDPSHGLYEALQTVMNFELEQHELFPSYLCNICADKVLTCQELINKCKQTNELLQRCKYNDFKQEDTKVTLESLPTTEIEEFVDSDGPNSDSNLLEIDNQEHRYSPKLIKLKQFPHEEVAKAIEEVRSELDSCKTCIICEYNAGNFRSLSRHMSRSHESVVRKWCMKCNLLFDDLKKHWSSLHSESENTCRLCGSKLSSRYNLLQHLNGHAKIRTHKCNVCNKTFVRARHLEVHSKIHRKVKIFTCKYCKVTFREEYLLTKHLKKPHNCTVCTSCKQVFHTEEAFRQHNCIQTDVKDDPDAVDPISGLEHTEEDDETSRPKLCTVCSKEFTNNNELEGHMRIHMEDDCESKMALKRRLVTHKRTYSNEKPVCNICNQAFSSIASYRSHKKLRTADPEECVRCKRKFCTRNQIRVHICMNEHTAAKLFKCSHCEKRFIKKSYLAIHMKTHTNSKPFECHLCEKKFQRQYYLTVHLKTHSREKPFKCSYCQYACRCSYRLSVHIKHCHTEETTEN
ncbi:putative zinc-finger protein C2H2 type [Trypoxylus dichotomus]